MARRILITLHADVRVLEDTESIGFAQHAGKASQLLDREYYINPATQWAAGSAAFLFIRDLIWKYVTGAGFIENDGAFIDSDENTTILIQTE